MFTFFYLLFNNMGFAVNEMWLGINAIAWSAVH